MTNEIEKNNGEIIIYQSEDGKIRLDVRLEEKTVWLTIDQMAELYAKAVPLLERALLLYRIQEFYKPAFTYQRCYALKKLVKCQKELGNKTMAILYEHELRLLEATSEILTNDND